MAKRTSRAEIILRGARDRVSEAQKIVNHAKWQIEIATASLLAHEFALEQLEKDLAITPRKVKDPKSTAPSAGKRLPLNVRASRSAANTEGDKGSVTDANCAICGTEKSSIEHDKDLEGYHIFRTTLKKKNDKSNGGTVLPDNPEDFKFETEPPTSSLDSQNVS